MRFQLPRNIAAVAAALLIGLALATGPVHAAEPAGAAPQSPGQPSEEASVQGYGDHDKSCLAWTDACVSCRRDIAGALTCNNVGIACRPEAIKCTARRNEPAK